MLKRLKRWPLFMLLLPAFFVLHGYLENLDFIALTDVFLLIAIYSFATALVFLVFYFFYKKDSIKASITTTCIMFFYFFFGPIQNFLEDHSSYLHKFSVLLPLIAISIVTLIIFLKKTASIPEKLLLFGNSLLFIYITLDIVLIIHKKYNTPEQHSSELNSLKKITISPQQARPDIYFLLLDEYTSSAALKEYNGFRNDLDSFLSTRGFHVQKNSRSNYNFTVLSMASMLNLSYIEGLHNNMALTPDLIKKGYTLITENEVFRFLHKQGYKTINYSIFNFKGSPTPFDQTFLPTSTKLITSGTFFPILRKAVYWPIVLKRFHLENLIKLDGYAIDRSNKNIFNLTRQESSQHTENPKFVYTHFMAPHAPYFYDKNDQLRDEETLFKEVGVFNSELYLNNLLHINKEIKKLIDTIQYNTKGKAVIIVMGDHGFRIKKNDPSIFPVMNAVYFPRQNYTLLKDSTTCVNQFRMIFNCLFNQSIPLLEDSTMHLYEEK